MRELRRWEVRILSTGRRGVVGIFASKLVIYYIDMGKGEVESRLGAIFQDEPGCLCGSVI